MLTIYYHGCKCGTTAIHIRRVERWASENHEEVQSHNSKYSEDNRMYHHMYLNFGHYPSDTYTPIVVGHNSVKLLKEWRPS